MKPIINTLLLFSLIVITNCKSHDNNNINNSNSHEKDKIHLKKSDTLKAISAKIMKTSFSYMDDSNNIQEELGIFINIKNNSNYDFYIEEYIPLKGIDIIKLEELKTVNYTEKWMDNEVQPSNLILNFAKYLPYYQTKSNEILIGNIIDSLIKKVKSLDSLSAVEESSMIETIEFKNLGLLYLKSGEEYIEFFTLNALLKEKGKYLLNYKHDTKDNPHYDKLLKKHGIRLPKEMKGYIKYEQDIISDTIPFSIEQSITPKPLRPRL